MAEYKLTATDSIFRPDDDPTKEGKVGGTHIPPDPANRDYAEYLQWVEDGGVADPYVPPEAPEPEPSPEQQILFDHENRVRALEGHPPLTMEDFEDRIAKMVAT